MVSVSVEVPPTAIWFGENCLLMTGASSTARLAVAVPPMPPLAEVTSPVVFTATPEAESVTFTDTLQLLLAGTVPPVRLIDGSPEPGEKLPPQVLLVFGSAATTMPEGNVSLTDTPV